jgi:uncharacterized protein (UPF0147 family)
MALRFSNQSPSHSLPSETSIGTIEEIEDTPNVSVHMHTLFDALASIDTHIHIRHCII